MKLFILLLLLAFTPSALAVSGELPLLTIREDDPDRTGGLALLRLEIEEGEGRIFIDSFPLSKLDTQISVRFANQVACDSVETDCELYDFFYTIRSDSSVVSGPSAGAGIAVLTASLLTNTPLDKGTVITGTINSGGTVGPVGGVRGKALAAEANGFDKILVPTLSYISNTTNLTGVEIEVVPVGTLEESLNIFTGKNFVQELPELSVPEFYSSTMIDVADRLCNRSDYLGSIASLYNETLINQSTRDLQRSAEALVNGQYYAAASSCFSASLALRRLEIQDDSRSKVVGKFRLLNKAIQDLSEVTDGRELRTLSDFETYAIVKDRVLEAQQTLVEIDFDNYSRDELAYAFERYYSAVAWSKFFGHDGPSFSLDTKHSRTACIKRLEETEERINYLDFLIPGDLPAGFRDTIDRAYADLNRGEYPLCVFAASKAKAEINTVLDVIAVGPDEIDVLVDQKITQAELVVRKQIKQGYFPIMGYSYLEYARFLQEQDPRSALTFAEYSIELSDLDSYFPKENGGTLIPVVSRFDSRLVVAFVIGLLAGTFAMLPFVKNAKKRRKRRKRS